MTFEDLKLIAPLLRAAADAGYTQPSPIQQQAIAPVLEGRDLVGCAQTGTGKTAAFAMPILQRLYAAKPVKGKRPIRALVLTPTRELAIQIEENFVAYSRHLPLKTAVIYGGVSQTPQVGALTRGVDILVATPGRLLDLVDQGHVKLSEVEIFVLDEADRMLDMGFVHDVRRVLAKLPQKRQTLLFSATMPPEIVRLTETFLTDPVHVAVTPVSSPVERIEQRLYYVDKANKTKLLVHLLEDASMVSVLVFVRTKHGADRVARDLSRSGVQAQAIHGDKSQGARQSALSAFKAGKLRVLVATDIAARGIDVVELSHVVNYNLSEVAETYIHRIGRTGRAGMGGVAIAFCTQEEKIMLRGIERLMNRSIPAISGHPYPLTETEGQKPELREVDFPMPRNGSYRGISRYARQGGKKPSGSVRPIDAPAGEAAPSSQKPRRAPSRNKFR